MPLEPGDPGILGPFRLDARLQASAAGIVYLGTDPYGRRVTIALLTTAAAGDAAARDRFRAAITAETPVAGDVPGPPPAPEGPAPVVAAFTEGEAPWVATPYEEGRPGAERFLEPVLLRRGRGVLGRRRGPQFQPYWAESPAAPALRPAGPSSPAAQLAALEGRGLATAVLSLTALLALLAFLAFLLFSCEPSSHPTSPIPTYVPTPVPTTRVPVPPPVSPVSPTPIPTRTSRPDPSDTTNPLGGPTARPWGSGRLPGR